MLGGGSKNCFTSQGCGTVFELVREAKGHWKHQILYSFTGGGEGYFPNGVIVDNAGVLYGTTQLGGDQGCGNSENPGCGTIFALTRTTDHGWKHHRILAFPPGDGQNPGASLAADSSGNFYGTAPRGGAFADNVGGIVFKLDRQANGGWKESILHSFGGPNDGESPAGNLIIDASGSIYGITPTQMKP